MTQFFTRFSRVLLPRGHFIYQTHVKKQNKHFIRSEKSKIIFSEWCETPLPNMKVDTSN